MNATFERWLEAALAREAPGLEGGLGSEGPEDEPYAPYEPLEEETILAILEEDTSEPESRAMEEQASELPGAGATEGEEDDEAGEN